MKFIDSKTLQSLRDQYPVGVCVELIQMDDVQAPPIGTRGKVAAIDDMGTIFVHWDNGSGLGIVYGADLCRLVSDEG